MIKQAVNDLRKNPYAGKDLQEELFGFKSFRSKQYRIIYKLNETENFLQIYHIGRRSNVYEQFQRLLTELQKP
jgi:mRNA-degrading endonuclease RelE of RelBE toxin-antitoxin system